MGLPLGPLVLLALLGAPMGLDPQAQRVGAVFALVAVWWITEAVPLAVTALLGPTLVVLLGAADAKAAYASFGDPILFLFMGSFLIARGMEVHGLDRRLALFVLSRRWVGESPLRILLAFGLTGFVLSMWISNTAAAAMMFPIAAGVLATLDRARPTGEPERPASGSNPVATGLMLMVAYSCSLGGVATPIGTPPNLIALAFLREMAGVEIGFLRWMLLVGPIALFCFAGLFAVIAVMHPPGAGRIAGAGRVIAEERRKLGPWTAGEKAALAAFSIAISLWILPGILALALPGDGSPVGRLLSQVPEPAAALLGALALFVLPGGRQGGPALEWREAVRIDWGTILLFGGGLAMGKLATGTGLAAELGSLIEAVSGRASAPVLLLAVIPAAVLLTEIMSNTATANLLIPLCLALPAAAGPGGIQPALGAAIGCSLAFCLPVSTPPNAIAYASGRIPIPTMIRTGAVLDLLCILVTWGGLLLLGGNP